MRARRICTIANSAAMVAATTATTSFHGNGRSPHRDSWHSRSPVRGDARVRETPQRKQSSPNKQRGIVAIEFVLVLPVLLMIIFGIVELGIAFYDKAVITNAAREGARQGIVLRSPKPTDGEITAAATSYTKNYLLTFGQANDPVVEVNGSGGNFGSQLSVKVSYRYEGLGLGKMLSAVTGPITLSATSTMRNE